MKTSTIFIKLLKSNKYFIIVRVNWDWPEFCYVNDDASGYIDVGDGCWRRFMLWKHWDVGDQFEILVTYSIRSKSHQRNGAKKLLCGNVRNFSMTKNACAHRVQHTRISLGPNFGASSSLIFKDFWVWKLKSRVLCTARNVHSVSANLKNFC